MKPTPLNSKFFSQQPITVLKGIGPQVAERFYKLGIYTLQDCVFHLPFRYQDRTRITPISALQIRCDVVIEGEVQSTQISFGRRRSLACRLKDKTGVVTLRFFHFSAAQKNQLKTGTCLRCFGETRRGASGIEMYHPEYKIQKQGPEKNTEQESSEENKATEKLSLQKNLTPVYPLTDGMTQTRLRNTIEQAVHFLTESSLQDLLSKEDQEISLANSLKWLHSPPVSANIKQLSNGDHPYQQRLAKEELVAHHLSLLRLRQRLKVQPAPILKPDQEIEQQFLSTLPFKLTAAQQKVCKEIKHDLVQPEPMLRLLQGDVGSGKTLVAALAALQAIANGKQVALMAPTEILAEQHYTNFKQWFAVLNIKIAWLTGSLKVAARRENLALIASGQASLIVGTHALFQTGVEYADLALIIIDEQHRFGVQQRLALSEKGKRSCGETPHQLTMTATPIPRTLAMSVYADMDCSVIDELPPGRTPVNTVLIDNKRREQVIERVRAACASGTQTYWVCTLIEEPEEDGAKQSNVSAKQQEKLQVEAAETTASILKESLPHISIGLVHGRLKTQEKAHIMQQFKAGDIQLLVATTVIEVGVDVPNASLMIIENPERLGLAQLHQLRGRVGRGGSLQKQQESHCVLLYKAPLSQQGRERLSIMRQTTDGFVIAEKDLQLRGPGEVLGTQQTGEIQFHIADLQNHAHLLPEVKNIAQQLLQQETGNVEALIERWLGNRAQYGKV